MSQVANGQACIDGALGFLSPYYGGIWKRANWYKCNTSMVENRTFRA